MLGLGVGLSLGADLGSRPSARQVADLSRPRPSSKPRYSPGPRPRPRLGLWASAEDLASLVDVVSDHNVPAVFGETTVSERLAAAVASESGATLVRLYSGSLDKPGTEAATYIGMMRANVGRIVDALR